MKCDEIEQDQLIPRYLDGTLDRAQRDAFEFHTRSCIDCMVKLENLKAERRGAAPQVEKPSLWARLHSKRWIVLTCAAILVLVAGFLVAAQKTNFRRTRPVNVTLPAGDVNPVREALIQELAFIRPLPYRASTRTLPLNAELRHLQGIQLYKDGRFGQAANAFRDVLAVDPNDSHSRLFMGASFAAIGELPKAEEALTPLARKHGEQFSDEAKFVLAKVLFGLGRIPEGMEYLRPLAAEGNPLAGNAVRLLDLAEQVK